MSNYAESRIRQALKEAGGNAARARQLLMARAFEDPKLLYALTRQHLNGIVSYHIQRVIRRTEQEKSEAEPALPDVTLQAAEARQDMTDNLGLEVLKALASSGNPVFGQDMSHITDAFSPGPSRSMSGGKTSARHQQAIQAMISKGQTDSKEGKGNA